MGHKGFEIYEAVPIKELLPSGIFYTNRTGGYSNESN